MKKEYQISVDTGGGGYSFMETLSGIISDVKEEYGKKEAKKVKKWAKTAMTNDEYVSQKGRLHVYCL